jgi:hypothetical protein
MSQFINLKIKFKDSRYEKSNVDQVLFNLEFESQLEIEFGVMYLNVNFESMNGLKVILFNWLTIIDNVNFGKHISVQLCDNNYMKNLIKIDFNDCILIRQNLRFFSDDVILKVQVTNIKFYWSNNKKLENTGSFYLEERGFRIVEPYFSIFREGQQSENEIIFYNERLKGMRQTYKLMESTFRPDFDYDIRDNFKEISFKTIKKPKIQFYYNQSLTEEKALLYADLVLLLASFYYHTQIKYIEKKIYLPMYTVTVIDKSQNRYLDFQGNLYKFGIKSGFNKFLELDWQEETLQNYKLLYKVIKLFNQSHHLEGSMQFLIRFNIIEIIDKTTNKTSKFDFEGKVTEQALNLFLDNIKNEDHEDFKKVWNGNIEKLKYRTLKSQYYSFIESQKLNPESFDPSLDEVKKLRDNITHGKMAKVDPELLRRANELLYLINGACILNLMGIKDWSFNTAIK